MQDRVMEHKLRKVKAKRTEVPAQQAVPLQEDQADNFVRDLRGDKPEQTVVVSAEDLAMMRNKYPEVLRLLDDLCGGSDVPPWEEETALKKTKDSVMMREVVKRRRKLKDKSTAAGSTQ